MAVELAPGATLERPGEDGANLLKEEGILFATSGSRGELGAEKFHLADVVWPGLLRD